jgi:hypothetical protein
MSVLHLILVVLWWAVIAGGVVGAGYGLAELASARTKTGTAKDETRRGAWRSLFLSGYLIVNGCSRLLHGTTSWVLLGLGFCLLGAFFTMQVRSIRKA